MHSNDAESIIVKENNIKYMVYPTEGQKTGFYCDQRDNRQMIRDICKGKDVLDCYCYSGGFALAALLGIFIINIIIIITIIIIIR